MGRPEDERIRFVCWPSDTLGRVNRGSVLRHCVECLREIWVAPSTFKVIRRMKISKPLLTCVPCVDRPGRADKITVMPPEPEQIAEISGELRRGKN